MKRREFIVAALAGGVMLAIGPRLGAAAAEAGGQLRTAFAATTEPDMLRALFGASVPQYSNAIDLRVPLVTGGRDVPVLIRTSLPEVDLIAIAVPGNAHPLCTLYRPHAEVAAAYETAVRIDRSSAVTAFVRSRGQVYVQRRLVKVAISGF